VHGTRFTDKYHQARISASRTAYGTYAPAVPARSPPTSPRAGAAHASPPRKVVQDFAAFGAPTTSSVFGTAVAASPFSLAGNRAAFGAPRAGRAVLAMDDEDEEDEDGKGASGDASRIFLREDAVTLEQVCERARTRVVVICRVEADRCTFPRPDGSPCKAPGEARGREAARAPKIVSRTRARTHAWIAARQRRRRT
jgi:hypothetical protein